MLDKTVWKNQGISKLQKEKVKSEAVIIIEENGILEAKAVSYSSRNLSEIEPYNLVSVIAVKNYREGIQISQLYNQMIDQGIKVESLNSIVEAVNILRED